MSAGMARKFIISPKVNEEASLVLSGPSDLTAEFLCDLFSRAGFESVQCEYVDRECVNRKEEKHMNRTFLQAKFRRPVIANESAPSEAVPLNK